MKRQSSFSVNQFLNTNLEQAAYPQRKNYTHVHLVQSVRNHTLCMRVEETVACKLMRGAGVITKYACIVQA